MLELSDDMSVSDWRWHSMYLAFGGGAVDLALVGSD